MELGTKVKITARYRRNHHKPTEVKDCSRYDLIDMKDTPYEGFIMGKRTIHLEGVTSYESEEGCFFESMKTASVYVVAISMRETMYVPLDKVETSTSISLDVIKGD